MGIIIINDENEIFSYRFVFCEIFFCANVIIKSNLINQCKFNWVRSTGIKSYFCNANTNSL